MTSQTKIFSTLYGIDKNNKIKEWSIRVDNKGEYSIITYSYGYINGRKVECKISISSGKNLGKRNQTTHYQQALQEAQSKWKKKHEIDKYITDLSQINQMLESKISTLQTPLPMLAQDYTKQLKKVQFPCYIQPKLDGYRMIYNPITKLVTTRTGKNYYVLSGTQLYQELLNIEYCLDGELYVHDSNFPFENYGILRKQQASKLTANEIKLLDQIEYHVYDIIDNTLTFQQRFEKLQTLKLGAHIKIVSTLLCNSSSEIQDYHKSFTQNDHYEGSIIRNCNGMYKQKFRSTDLLKLKDFDDSEFKIIDFTCETDTGSNETPIIWICQTQNGKRFNVPSKGTKFERHEIFQNASKYVGKILWVKHFGWTQDGIPRFPKTMRNGIESIRENIN